jgi:hypothetical protein
MTLLFQYKITMFWKQFLFPSQLTRLPKVPTLFNIPYRGYIWLCVGKIQFIQYILQSHYFCNCTFMLLSKVPVFDWPAVSNPHQTKSWNIRKYTFLHTTWSSDQPWIYWPTKLLQPELSTPVPSHQSAAKSQWCICCL